MDRFTAAFYPSLLCAEYRLRITRTRAANVSLHLAQIQLISGHSRYTLDHKPLPIAQITRAGALASIQSLFDGRAHRSTWVDTEFVEHREVTLHITMHRPVVVVAYDLWVTSAHPAHDPVSWELDRLTRGTRRGEYKWLSVDRRHVAKVSKRRSRIGPFLLYQPLPPPLPPQSPPYLPLPSPLYLPSPPPPTPSPLLPPPPRSLFVRAGAPARLHGDAAAYWATRSYPWHATPRPEPRALTLNPEPAGSRVGAAAQHHH